MRDMSEAAMAMARPSSVVCLKRGLTGIWGMCGRTEAGIGLDGAGRAGDQGNGDQRLVGFIVSRAGGEGEGSAQKTDTERNGRHSVPQPTLN